MNLELRPKKPLKLPQWTCPITIFLTCLVFWGDTWCFLKGHFKYKLYGHLSYHIPVCCRTRSLLFIGRREWLFYSEPFDFSVFTIIYLMVLKSCWWGVIMIGLGKTGSNLPRPIEWSRDQCIFPPHLLKFVPEISLLGLKVWNPEMKFQTEYAKCIATNSDRIHRNASKRSHHSLGLQEIPQIPGALKRARRWESAGATEIFEVRRSPELRPTGPEGRCEVRRQPLGDLSRGFDEWFWRES